MLPVSSAAGTWTVPMDALFTATSAVCVTGLVVVDTGTYWSPFGHVVIALLIQVGGFGFMTGSTLLLFILVGRRTGLRDRMLVQASTGVPQLGEVTTLLRRIAVFTIAVELTGAAGSDGGLRRRGLGLGTGGVVGRLPLDFGIQQRRLRSHWVASAASRPTRRTRWAYSQRSGS